MNNPVKLSCEAIATTFLGAPIKRVGDELHFLCPRNDDHRPSLTINRRKDVWLCGPCGASGNAWQLGAFLFGLDPGAKKAIREKLSQLGLLASSASKGKIRAIYDYTDENGKLLFQVVRFEPKNFCQRQPDGKGDWIYHLQGVRRVPYKLPDLLRAEFVLIVEGERDVETAMELGFASTCNPGGAGKWRPEYSEYFRGKKVAIIADADDAGRKHARLVARNLIAVADSVKVIECLSLKT